MNNTIENNGIKDFGFGISKLFKLTTLILILSFRIRNILIDDTNKYGDIGIKYLGLSKLINLNILHIEFAKVIIFYYLD